MGSKCRQQLKDDWWRSSGFVPRRLFHFGNAEQHLLLSTQSVKDSQAPGAGTWSPVKWPNLDSSNCHIYPSGGTAQLLKHHAPPCCSPRALSADSLSLQPFTEVAQVNAISGTVCLQAKLKQSLLNVLVHLVHFSTCSVHQQAHKVLFSCNVNGILNLSPEA